MTSNKPRGEPCAISGRHLDSHAPSASRRAFLQGAGSLVISSAAPIPATAAERAGSMNDIRRRDLRLDVSDATGLAPGTVSAAWLFYSRSVNVGRRATVLFCLHGGGYTRGYFHLQVPGYRDYSFAEHLARKGYIVVAIDHLGMGDSTHPENAGVLSSRVVAAANHAVVTELTVGL